MITETLSLIQKELKAPKGQFNSFGNYKYRSCEDILEAVKPIAAKYKAAVNCSDEIVLIGERYYIKATAMLTVGEENKSVTAFAREPESKKGMDESQITGTASSYARKYALNGLFAIDDTKDADTDENQKERTAKQKPKPDNTELGKAQAEIKPLLKKVAELLNTTSGSAYNLALANLKIKGDTAEDLKKVKEYCEGIIKNAEAKDTVQE